MILLPSRLLVSLFGRANIEGAECSIKVSALAIKNVLLCIEKNLLLCIWAQRPSSLCDIMFTQKLGFESHAGCYPVQ